jgi:tRNA(Ile)-lysidine synthase
LLQALRGAGPQGLATMPALADFGPGKLARPLLGFARAELQAWALAQKLTWLDDPSNADERFDRNYLRRQVIPMIRGRWPAAGETVSRSARHCADTLGILTALAGEDLVRCADPEGRTLAVDGLQALAEPRAKNLLRHWLEKLQLPPPPSHKLEQVFTEMLPAGDDRNPCVSWEGAELRRYRQRLYALPPLVDPPAGDYRLQPGAERTLGPGPGLGTLCLEPASGEGLRAAACPAEGFRLGFRTGGELCQPAGRTHHRPLKKWLQEYGVVPWMRERLPLIYAGEELAAVAGLFVCAAFAADQGEPGLRITWRSHPPLF